MVLGGEPVDSVSGPVKAGVGTFRENGSRIARVGVGGGGEKSCLVIRPVVCRDGGSTDTPVIRPLILGCAERNFLASFKLATRSVGLEVMASLSGTVCSLSNGPSYS